MVYSDDMEQLTDLAVLKKIAIIFIFAVLFGTAALDKWKTLQTPDWFIKQFENTLIAKLPGGATVGYWIIATFELLLALAFVASLAMGFILPYALVGSLFLFGMLCFGLRLASDFQGSANMFIYFSAALISLSLL